MLPTSLLIRTVVARNAGVLSRAAYHNGVPHTPTTMNHLPVPEGDWQEAYNKKQSRYNAQLLGSALFFFGIVAYIKQSKVIDFNWSPPKTYE